MDDKRIIIKMSEEELEKLNYVKQIYQKLTKNILTDEVIFSWGLDRLVQTLPGPFKDRFNSMSEKMDLIIRMGVIQRAYNKFFDNDIKQFKKEIDEIKEEINDHLEKERGNDDL